MCASSYSPAHPRHPQDGTMRILDRAPFSLKGSRHQRVVVCMHEVLPRLSCGPLARWSGATLTSAQNKRGRSSYRESAPRWGDVCLSANQDACQRPNSHFLHTSFGAKCKHRSERIPRVRLSDDRCRRQRSSDRVWHRRLIRRVTQAHGERSPRGLWPSLQSIQGDKNQCEDYLQ